MPPTPPPFTDLADLEEPNDLQDALQREMKSLRRGLQLLTEYTKRIEHNRYTALHTSRTRTIRYLASLNKVTHDELATAFGVTRARITQLVKQPKTAQDSE